MMSDSLLSRSFSKHEKKKLGYGGLIICFIIALSLSTVFKPYLDPLPVLNLRLSIGKGQKLKILNETSNSLLISNEVLRKNTSLASDATNSEKVARNAEIARKNDELIDNTSISQQVVKDAYIFVNVSAVKLNNGNSSKQIVIEVEAKMKNDKNPAIFTNTSNSQQIILKDVECSKLERSDFCKIKGDIRIDPISSTVYIISSEKISQNTSIFTIRPYARKGDPVAMNNVRQWSLNQLPPHHHHQIPQCSQFHHLPAILFSLGGYSGNHFHAFTDIIIPLYSTARPYNRSVQFLVTDYRPWLVSKFKMLLKGLSEYEIINIDKKDDNIHCFTDLTLGLKRYSTRELSIDPSKDENSSMKDFKQLLRSSYSLRKTTALKIKNKSDIGIKKRPKLVIISRKRSRAFSNVDEIANLAKGLGFKVVVYEPDADLSRSAQVLNSCDVVLGVHGAGLTNMVFLPENAILIQVIPFGGAEWVSKNYFEEPSKDMNIRYLEYKISLKESSLIQQYPSDHLVLRNPYVIQKQGWMVFKSIYFDKQNVKLDLNRFKPTLLKALELLHK